MRSLSEFLFPRTFETLLARRLPAALGCFWRDLARPAILRTRLPVLTSVEGPRLDEMRSTQKAHYAPVLDSTQAIF